MNPLRRKSVVSADEPADVDTEEVAVGKGRPTPKRRTRSAPPAPAPRTRKEAMAYQKRARSAAPGRSNMTSAQYRAAVRNGDPTVLPRREQGPVRALARDYVDSHRMLSNYLLLLFGVFLVGELVLKVLQIVALAFFLIVIVEWFVVGGRIRRLAEERSLGVKEGSLALGFYAGSRAYMPRKWRRPSPRVTFGDKF